MGYNILIDDIKDNHAEFVRIHNEGDFYGGSDVANICGVGYISPLEVWLKKTGKRPSVVENDQMRLGSYMEPFLLDMLERRLNKRILPVNQVWQHENRPWMIVSPDAVTQDAELVEFKTHKIYASQYWDENTASDSAMCQAHWGLAVSDCKAIYCAALIGGDTDKFYHPRFERDNQVMGQLIERVEAFRELVKADIPPQAGAGDADLIREHLIRDYDKGKQVDLTEKHTETLKNYRKLLEKKDKIKPEYDKIETEIKALKNQFLADSAGSGEIVVGKDHVRLTKIVRQPSMSKGSEYFTVNIRLGE